MMPLKHITIPVGYLLPDFQGELKQKEDNEVDIFRFGTQSVEKIIQQSIKSHIRDYPESIVLTSDSERSVANKYIYASY